MSKEQEIENLISPAIESLGLECLGLVFSPSRGSALLRVYIDQAERGITLDDCEAVSREISALLDVNDPIASRYTLEVSSPGIDRPLFKAAQFARFVGEKVKLSVKLPVGGRRRFQGAIVAVVGEAITLSQDGQNVTLQHGNVESAKLQPDLDEVIGKPEKPGKPGTKKKPTGAGKAPKKGGKKAN